MAQQPGMAGGLPDEEVALAGTSGTWAGGTTDGWTYQVAGHVAGWVAGQVVAGIGSGVQRGIWGSGMVRGCSGVPQRVAR